MVRSFFLATVLLILLFPAPAQRLKGYQSAKALPAPEIFAEGVISTGDYDSHAAFSPSGDTLLFVKSGPDLSKWTICISYYKNERWSSPEVAPFSGQYMDADPFFSKDGKTLYFISNRPVHTGEAAKSDMDIWKIERTPKGWGELIHPGAPINSEASEYYPTLTDNGVLYFGSRRNGGLGGADIYRCAPVNGTYTDAQNLGDAINSDGSEYEPFISPDEKFLIFLAARPDHLDNADLYISYYRGGRWTKAEKLPEPFNSPVTEFSPKITRDNRYFFFASTRNRNPPVTPAAERMTDVLQRIRSCGNGLGDIYRVDLSALRIKIE